MQYTEADIYYDVALSFVQGVGPKVTAALIEEFGSARLVLSAPLKQLLRIEGMGEIRARAIKDTCVFARAEKEINYAVAKGITILSPLSEAYPKRLLHCADAPGLLYYRGTANLNRTKIVAVVGTRKNTEYGQRLTHELLEGLSGQEDLLVVSGLAHGIDTLAHKAALSHQVETVGVLGHGLGSIYPAANRALAKSMLEHGGLLTEFPFETKAEKGNFPARNRIVAGLSDVTVIVESDIKGGALITGYIANSYNREVAAFPGRAYDNRSSGTNMMIRKNLAALISSADDLLELMGWQQRKKQDTATAQLMLQLSEEEQTILKLLQAKDSVHADELQQCSGMGSTQLASTLLLLEMQGLVKTLPGKSYRLS
jgi:DNA processing protein